FGVDRLVAGHERADHDAVGADRDGGRDGGDEADEDDGGPQAPADYLTLKWTSGRDVSPDQGARAGQQAAAVPQGAGGPGSGGGSWSVVGPSNVGARVVDLVVDPARANTLYTAVSGGGVWKSTDAGNTWQPSWPNDVTQTMGALAIGPDGTLWAGTGEANPSGG